MNKLTRIFVLVLIAAVVTFGITGCKEEPEAPSVGAVTEEAEAGKSAVEKAATEAVEAGKKAAEKAASEHPASEHPTGEHPK